MNNPSDGKSRRRFPDITLPLLLLAIFLGFLALKATAQTNIYLYREVERIGGVETNVTLSPGVYEITAYGAQGGEWASIPNGGGSDGAEMEGQFRFATTVNLTLLVGGAGGGGKYFSGTGAGGGGGGSFVVNGSMPLVVAGGGGGYGGYNGGGGGSITTDGGTGGGYFPYYGGSGGANGSGGSYASSNCGGGGGGGFSGNGSGGSGFSFGGGGGNSFLNGSGGGSAAASNIGGNGGYGGGGEPDPAGDSHAEAGGGGGGYSGGGGGSGGAGWAGGGGGSYIDPSAIGILTEINTAASPDGSPNGEIIIESFPTNNLVLLTQPSSQTVADGQTATFSVSAAYSPPFSYQWLFDGTNIASATNATYSISNVQSNNDGAYSVIVSDAVTNVSSTNAILTVFYPTAETTFYVDIHSTNPTPPYTNWATASTDIQSALNLTTNSDLILVNPGVYQSGGYTAPDLRVSSVVVSDSVVLQSTGGASVTTINGINAMRCVYLASGAVLNGFTLLNGSAGPTSEDPIGGLGGGVYCGSINSLVLNCQLLGNTVSGQWTSSGYSAGGGGAFQGTLSNCTLSANVALVGGGAYYSVVDNCILTNNFGQFYGGGASECDLTNCLIIDNSCEFYSGGGIDGCVAVNCTIVNNSAPDAGGADSGSTPYNCIIYDNSSSGSQNYDSGMALYNCCTTPLPGEGTGNIAGPPGFVNLANNFRLAPGSPCINAGDNSYIVNAADLDGNPRIVGAAVDIGAYEYPPTIAFAEEPVSQTGIEGQLASFSAAVFSPLPASYQWQFDGTDIPWATNAILSLSDVQSNNAGVYDIVVSNGVTTVTSSNAYLTVIYPPPIFTLQPANAAVVTGSNATFSADATNYYPLSFQWQINGTNLTDGGQIIGSTNSVLTIAGAEDANAGTYQLIAYDTYGATTSSIASLTIYDPPHIIGQPSSETLLSGINTGLTVIATGNPLYYQWYCNGLPLTDNGNISGSTSSTLRFSNVQTNNSGVYWVWVTNFLNAESSSNATLTVYNPAQIVTQPANAGVLLGSNVSFTVSATGTAVGYQWYFDGRPLTDNGRVTGSLTPTLSITNVGNSDGGDYQLLVTNLLSSAMSRLATLTPLTNLARSIRYVNVSNSVPASPYLSWSTAAANIQTAVNASINGDQIVVTDGVYQVGGNTSSDGVSNRVFVSDAITLLSVNGSAATLINGSGFGRCVYLTNGATLSGFTLTNGYASGNGGGAYCVSTNSFISNCLFINNIANQRAGGAYFGSLNNCTLIGNVSKTYGGGAYGSILTNCLLTGNSATNNGIGQGGGGGANCTFNNCYLNNNASGEGGGAYSSTLNNCTVSNNAVIANPWEGGGVYGCTVQNSLIVSNSAQLNQSPNEGFGGGAFDSTLANCLIEGNRAGNGGGVVVYPGVPVNNGVLIHCTLIGNWAYGYGGGFAGSGNLNLTLTNCVISGNRAGNGGGVYFAKLFNCLVADNVATNLGGGVDDGLLYNCTVCQNSAATQSGGMYVCSAYDSIVYYNTAPQSPDVGGTYSAKNCCFGQGVSNGTGFFTNAPQLVNLLGGDFHLQSNSPCINAGNNAYTNTATDLDGNPRIVAGTVDIGAYEYQSPVSMVSYLWLEQYGLPITTNTDTSSPDGTAFDVYQDWIAGLNPTNPASVLVMLPVTVTNNASGIKVAWQSVSGILYNLQRSTNLAAPSFSTLQSNLTGQAGTTSYTDTTATNGGPYFYRVGVQ